MIGVYLTNLRKYNEGELFGEWLSLPMYEDDLKREFDKIIGKDDEYFISDYDDEYGFGFGEYEDIFKLNELLNKVDDMNKVAGIMEWKGYDLEEAVEEQDNYEFTPNMSGVEYEEEMVDECYDLEDKLGWINNYVDIDYERMAEDDNCIYEFNNGLIREY